MGKKKRKKEWEIQNTKKIEPQGAPRKLKGHEESGHRRNRHPEGAKRPKDLLSKKKEEKRKKKKRNITHNS